MITPSYGITTTEHVLPRMMLDFTTASLDPRVTLQRALDTATRVNSSGFIELVNANLPRFDFSPTSVGACRGLLIEEPRTNLALQSAAFDNTTNWTRGGLNTVIADDIVSPDGTENADKIVENTSNTTHSISTAIAVATAAGSTITLSVFAKAGERSWIALYDGVAGKGKFFNIFTGEVGGNLVSPPVSASISNAGGGWYRCSIVVTAAASTILSIFLSTDGTAFSYTGDGTSGAYLWGAQIETGAFASSYIPTTTGSVLRNADVVYMSGTNFSDWYSASEGTICAVADTLSTSGHIYSIDNGINERIFQLAIVGSTVNSNIVSSGTNTFAQAIGTVASGVPVKTSLAYKADNANSAVNTVAGTTDTSVTIPTVVQLRIGTNVGGIYLNGHVASIRYFPIRLTNAELQAFSK